MSGCYRSFSHAHAYEYEVQETLRTFSVGFFLEAFVGFFLEAFAHAGFFAGVAGGFVDLEAAGFFFRSAACMCNLFHLDNTHVKNAVVTAVCLHAYPNANDTQAFSARSPGRANLAAMIFSLIEVTVEEG